MTSRRNLAARLGGAVILGLFGLGTLALGGVVGAAPASAQSVCGERAEIVKQLEKGYAESRRAIGLASNGTLLEVFASKAGNWTVLMTFPDGRACMMANGEAWKLVPPQPDGEAV